MTEPAPIRVLSDAVINQIAAGEVVERPASVLKELVENSIDAGATWVEVDIVDGGRRLVRVRDDGTGMDRDNALLSLERHATSKLREFKDLDSIETMGFRGEALAAIASVSQFSLATQRNGSATGTEILVFGGKIQEVRDAGLPQGTEIAVRNLFFNVPARRKFLRTAQTEFTHVRQAFILEALANAGIGFVLRADDSDVYRLPPASNLLERIRDLYGDELAFRHFAGWTGSGRFFSSTAGLLDRPSSTSPFKTHIVRFFRQGNTHPCSSASACRRKWSTSTCTQQRKKCASAVPRKFATSLRRPFVWLSPDQIFLLESGLTRPRPHPRQPFQWMSHHPQFCLRRRPRILPWRLQ